VLSVDALLAGQLPWPLEVRVLPTTPEPVTRVVLLEQLQQSDAVERGALVVLTRASVETAGGYQFDVLMRQAAQRRVAVVVLRRSTPRSITAETIAMRGDVTLLDVHDDVDPAELVDELATLVAGDARAALRMLATAASRRSKPVDESEPAAVVERIAATCGVRLEYATTRQQGDAEVEVDGVSRGVVRPLDPGDVGVVAARLAADAASAALALRERTVLTPVRTTSAALSQLLLCSQAHLRGVATRAAEVGLDVDAWHCAARLTVVEARERRDPQSDLPRLEEEVLALVAAHASDQGGKWSVARPDDSVVLVWTARHDRNPDAPNVVRAWMEVVTSTLGFAHPGLRFRVGIATAHQGPSGLRVSAEESRTAMAAASLSDDSVSMVAFDSLGAQRMLAEWLVTDTARGAVRDLLAPLDALGLEKSETAVKTLHAYLDERGSLQRAAARLHVHRNAVVYRIANIKETLDIDLSDPDNRFALQLACRARLMTMGGR